MRKLGDGKIVCVDSTHSTTGYDFSLVTVVVVDEYGEGYPVGWCLSNREDAVVMRAFFEAIKKKVGIITPAWFMSDDADQFYNAWIAVFGKQPKKLLCIWHVDRAWREKLSLIDDKEMQTEVYHNLRVLMEEKNTDEFEKLYDSTIHQLSACADTQKYCDYFVSTYGKRKNQWAMCYRQGSFINTNMYVEAFHRVLKYIYLKGTVNKRVDKCIHVLLKIARDKFFDRLVKGSKGKYSFKLEDIRKRHDKSEDISFAAIQETSEGVFNVMSSTGNGNYTVTALDNTICSRDNCMLYCSKCNVCLHTYSCTCPDYSIAANMCKHIHFIGRFKAKGVTEVKSIHPSPPPILQLHSNEIHSVLSLGGKPTSVIESRRKALRSVQQLTALIEECNDEEMLTQVNSEINTSIRLLKCELHNVTLPVVSQQEPANKKLSPQRRFFSTRKRNRVSSVKIAKPTNEEKNEIIAALSTDSKAYKTKKTAKGTQMSLVSQRHVYVMSLIFRAAVLSLHKRLCTPPDLE